MTIDKHDAARGKRIEDLMQAKGWTGPSLAKAVSAERSTVKLWVEGGPISGTNVGPLVEALETTRLWLVSGQAASALEPGEADRLRQEMSELRSDLSDEIDAAKTELLGEIERALAVPASSKQSPRPVEED